MVILLSTRGTAGSDIWFMCLAEKPMVRGYHLRDYDWTPLSQNPAQKCNDTVSASMLGGNYRHGSTGFGARGGQATATGSFLARNSAPVCLNDIHPIKCRGAKSFVDDLGLGRGVVRSRAATSLRSVETKPFDWEICPLTTDTSLASMCLVWPESFFFVIISCFLYLWFFFPIIFIIIFSNWIFFVLFCFCFLFFVFFFVFWGFFLYLFIFFSNNFFLKNVVHTYF